MKSYEDDLISRTRCFNCDELGHISKDCPLKQESRQKGGSSTMGPRKQFLMTSTGPQCFMFASQPARLDDKSVPYRLMIFHAVQCQPFEALVDTAAEEAVIGHRAMERLENELAQKGLRVLWQQTWTSSWSWWDRRCGKGERNSSCFQLEWPKPMGHFILLFCKMELITKHHLCYPSVGWKV